MDGASEENILSSEDTERILGVATGCPLGRRGGNGGGASESFIALSPLNDRNGAGVKESVEWTGNAEAFSEPVWLGVRGPVRLGSAEGFSEPV